MPDFPRTGGGATAAEVWAYGTKELTGLTGQPRTDLVGANESIDTHGYTTVRAGKLDNLDVAVSSRGTSNLTDALVWAYATKELTGLTGTPRSDLIGSDATLEATTGTRISRIDKLPAFQAITESSIVMTGSEVNLVEITDIKSGEIEAWADLTPMQAGDTIVVRYSKKVKAAGSYAKFAEETYSGAQTIPLLRVIKLGSYRDTKVTAQQTTGTNRTFDVQVIRTREA